jgi:excisionase family DNA binding protein
MGGDAMLTVAEAAQHARVCESIVRGWLKSGQLPHYRVGAKGKRGKIVIAIEDLEGLMSSFKVKKKEPEPKRVPVRTSFKHLRLS